MIIDISDNEQSYVQEYGIYILGPNSPYIKLISKDDYTFFLQRKHAMKSAAFKAMLNGPKKVAKNKPNIIQFKKMTSQIMKKLCSYLINKAENNDENETSEIHSLIQSIIDHMITANILDY